MKSIWFEDIVDVMLNISDPNTWAAVSEVPWVSAPKINGSVSIYNVESDWLWIAWWSTDVSWTPWEWSISWTSGNINLPDGSQISISSGSASVSSATYIYVDMTDGTVYSTTSAITAVWKDKIMICAAFPNSWKNVTFKAFGCADQSSLVTGSDIAANTIVAWNIATWTITANEIAGNTITASEIASGAITTNELDAWAVTAAKIDVSELSAISADLWSITAWDITGTTITAGNTNSGGIKLYPYSSSAWRIEFYYSWDMVGYMQWLSWGVWWAIAVSWDYFYLDTTVLCAGKLRIPVWTNLYN